MVKCCRNSDRLAGCCTAIEVMSEIIVIHLVFCDIDGRLGSTFLRDWLDKQTRAGDVILIIDVLGEHAPID